MQKVIPVGLLSAAFAFSITARAQSNSTPGMNPRTQDTTGAPSMVPENTTNSATRVQDASTSAASTQVSTEAPTGATTSSYQISPDAAAKAFTAQVTTHECNIPFGNGEVDANRVLLNTCVTGFKNSEVKFISIAAGASPGGSLRANKRVSDKRAEMLRAELTRMYPNARIEAHGIGVQAVTGRSARIVAVTAPTAEMAAAEFSKISTSVADTQPTTTTSSTSPSLDTSAVPAPDTTDLNKVNLDASTKLGSDKSDRENWMRLALRGANDRYYDDDKYYGSAGLELAYVRSKTLIPSVRGELGATGSAMLDNDSKNSFRGYNTHAFVGPAFAYNGFVVGARALGGGIWEEQRKFRADGGGEGRLGFESPNGLSIFAGAGRTNKLARYGVDLGMIF